jgi:hypothetical protein
MQAGGSAGHRTTEDASRPQPVQRENDLAPDPHNVEQPFAEINRLNGVDGAKLLIYN